MAERRGAREELRGQQVLAVRGQLDDPVGLRDPEALVVEEPQRVVLVVDQAPDRAEGRLVLELAVEDRASDPVPAIGPRVARREDLAEELRPVRQGHQERRGPARSLVPEGLQVGHLEAELFPHRGLHRVAPGPGELEVRSVPPARVRDRERLVGREPLVHDEGDGGGQRDRVERRRRVGRAELDPRRADHEEHGRDDPASPAARTLGHERPGGRVERDREGRDRDGGEEPGGLAVQGGDDERRDGHARRGERGEIDPERDRHEVHRGERPEGHHEVPPPLEDREHQHHREPDPEDRARGREHVDRLRDVVQGGGAERGGPLQDLVVDRERATARGDRPEHEPDHHDRGAQPEPAGPPRRMRERGRLARGAPEPAGPVRGALVDGHRVMLPASGGSPPTSGSLSPCIWSVGSAPSRSPTSPRS